LQNTNTSLKKIDREFWSPMTTSKLRGNYSWFWHCWSGLRAVKIMFCSCRVKIESRALKIVYEDSLYMYKKYIIYLDSFDRELVVLENYEGLGCPKSVSHGKSGTRHYISKQL